MMNRRTHVVTLAMVLLAASHARAQQFPEENDTAEQNQIKIFSLGNSPADDAAEVLQKILLPPSVRRSPSVVQNPVPDIQIAVHKSTNSLIVRGPAGTLAIAEMIVQRLDEKANQGFDRDALAALRKRVDRLEHLLKAQTSQRSSSSADVTPRAAAARQAAAIPAVTAPTSAVAPPAVEQVANKPAKGTPILAPAPSPDGKPTRIKHMATAGTRVKKGDVLVEFEAPLQDFVDQQRVALETSKARVRGLEAEIQQVKSDGELAIAELAFRFESAESALSTYRKVNVVLEVKKTEIEVAALSGTVATRETAVPKSAATQRQLDDAKRQLELAKMRHQLLVDIQIPAELTRLEGERKLAGLALEIVRKKVAVELDKFAADKQALAIAVQLNEAKLAELREALGSCVLKAPHDGIVEAIGDSSPLRVGARVRENQPLLMLRMAQEEED